MITHYISNNESRFKIYKTITKLSNVKIKQPYQEMEKS